MKKIIMALSLCVFSFAAFAGEGKEKNAKEIKITGVNQKKDICVNTEEKFTIDVFCPNGSIGASIWITVTTRHCIGKPDRLANVDVWFDDDPCN